MATSDKVRARLKQVGRRYHANDCIADVLMPGEMEEMQAEVEGLMAKVLDALVIDQEGDHNSKGTAKRYAKMLLQEVFAGRYQPKPDVTDFPNVEKLDQLYVTGPIDVRSACSHHLVPILGQAWIGVIPGDRVIGLSKFSRLTQWVMTRPQIQEEATMMLADEIEAACKPLGLGIVVKAQHLCCGWRGVKDKSSMTTSVMRGLLKTSDAARNEFMMIVNGHGFSCS